MINFDYITKENIKKKRNLNWQKISNHPYGTLLTGGFGSRKNKFIV